MRIGCGFPTLIENYKICTFGKFQRHFGNISMMELKTYTVELGSNYNLVISNLLETNMH